MKDNNVYIDELELFGEEDFDEKMKLIAMPILNDNRETGDFFSSDGIKLYYERYLNPEEKGEIVISHGFCEFTAKYEEVIYYFYQAGYSVYIFDYRGHGKSGRKLVNEDAVYVEDYEEYVTDLHCFVTQVVQGHSNRKNLVLFAHSMGGAIGALYLEQHPDVFSCAILSSPMLKVNTGRIPVFITWTILALKKLTKSGQGYVPGQGAFQGVPRFESSSCLSVHRYNHIFAKREQESRYQTYGASWSWTFASMKAVRKLQKQAKKVAIPILLLQAGKDTMVKNIGQNEFAKNSKNTRLVVIPGAKHEIYNGNTKMRQNYYREIFEFLANHLKN